MNFIINVNNHTIEDNNKLYKDMISKQIKVTNKNKLSTQDIQRITKNLNNSIFDIIDCSIWKGYITNINNKNRGTYINFYFKKKKVALHRLLYNNYIMQLSNNEYIKYTCKNKGKCCNINHMKKFEYNTKKKNIILNKIGDKHLNKMKNIIKNKKKSYKNNICVNNKKKTEINFL